MDAIAAIMSRRSIRQFEVNAEVKEEDLRTILEAGNMAPTAGNLQPFYFIVVRDLQQRQRIQQAAFGQELLGQVPLIIAVCVDPERSAHYGDVGRNHWCLLDAANATENMLLAAHALGYGTCWVGGFDPNQAREVLGLPPGFRVVSLVPVGRAALNPEVPPHRPLEEVIRWDRW